ncbi:MAG TPA: hypothetical protein VF324_07185 [Methanobacterium sp.]
MLIHITVVPTVTFIDAGTKLAFCIVTVFDDCEVHPETATTPKTNKTPKTRKFLFI